MTYKRAKKQLIEAGIYNIEIKKGLWGPYPEFQNVTKQCSQCFNTWQEAVKAVIEGYRPEVLGIIH